jgi:hypothetical protein
VTISLPATVRFWVKVEKTETCWLWTGARNNTGYGSFKAEKYPSRKTVTAHRWAYEDLVGPIPNGLTLDHLCKVRHCVNPAHLEPITLRGNIERGNGKMAKQQRQTHCIHGHLLQGSNLRLEVDSRGRQHRKCRTCYMARSKRRYYASKSH